MDEIITDPLKLASKWISAGKSTVLATVIDTWGSSPRPVGSHLVVNIDGEFAGSVSGGCIENEVIIRAREIMDSYHTEIMEFNIKNETAWESGLSCGGRMQVFLERLG